MGHNCILIRKDMYACIILILIMYIFFVLMQQDHQSNGYSNSGLTSPPCAEVVPKSPTNAEVPKPAVNRDAGNMEANLSTTQQHFKLFPCNA